MEALNAAAPEINRASTRGIVHANLAARKISRLNSRVKALSV
jgi:small subunit ribosomal protein S20